MDKRNLLLREIVKRLPEKEGVIYEFKDDRVNVFADGELMLHIRQSGGVSYPVNAVPDEKRNELHNIICKTADEVREFVNAMEYAPKLAADGLTEDYKKLLEYNGVVLAGTITSSDEYNFTTWSYKNNSLDHGHYYMSDYMSAKEDFVKRSGLMQENQIYSADERVEMARCIEDTLIEHDGLCAEKQEMLSNLYEKIEESVPDFNERLGKMMEMDYNREKGQQEETSDAPTEESVQEPTI